VKGRRLTTAGGASFWNDLRVYLVAHFVGPEAAPPPIEDAKHRSETTDIAVGGVGAEVGDAERAGRRRLRQLFRAATLDAAARR
jgi:hypothetical protein